jgi:hypothetical protein
VEEFRRSTASLGTIIRDTYKERNIFWEPPKAAQHKDQRARSRSPRRTQPKQPVTPVKVTPVKANATTAKTLRNGQAICPFHNTAKGCNKGASCPSLHCCNAIQKSGRVCGSKQHNNYNNGKGCSNKKVAGH